MEQIKKGLEGVTPVAWAWKGPKGGFLADDKKPSWDCEPLYSASTLESLQRENAILQERTADYPTISARLHDREKARDAEQKACREVIARAEAAEAEVKRLREALERFLPYHDAEYVPNTLFDIARTALASTGGEHNGN
ncbi:hypothetical protein [Agrobacterium sp. 10MFCol1.1]|uniref:hypothetical protein n=1 Tax=Agrobacterium sp. 10MFCol1.1 TaxID=1150775 RepID=UPI0012DDB13E|nr:hypothetical protein [Agrobacterium sp. 10MFCol1.1]